MSSDTQRDFDDFFSEVEATRENYFWKYYDDHGRPTLTHNPDRVEYRREVFGSKYTIVPTTLTNDAYLHSPTRLGFCSRPRTRALAVLYDHFSEDDPDPYSPEARRQCARDEYVNGVIDETEFERILDMTEDPHT